MPVYEYRCQKCRVVFDVERSMSDSSSQPPCSSCGCDDVSRIWNAVIRTGGITPDVGQGASAGASPSKKSGCGSCSSHSCGTCC